MIGCGSVQWTDTWPHLSQLLKRGPNLIIDAKFKSLFFLTCSKTTSFFKPDHTPDIYDFHGIDRFFLEQFHGSKLMTFLAKMFTILIFGPVQPFSVHFGLFQTITVHFWPNTVYTCSLFRPLPVHLILFLVHFRSTFRKKQFLVRNSVVSPKRFRLFLVEIISIH